MDSIDIPQNEIFESHYALLAAFKTMKERCQQLQTRLAAVEEENKCLKLECNKNVTMAVIKNENSSDRTDLKLLQEKVEELTKQKSQLTYRIIMVATENRQLWNRLTRLIKTNKSLGSQLTKISDTLKQHPLAQTSDIVPYNFTDTSNSDKHKVTKNFLSTTDDEKEFGSLEEISLRLMNSIMLEKSNLEQQYAEMVELHNSELNLQNIGFTYPEDRDTSSLEQLKEHENRLSQTKDALLGQQIRLKKILQNVKILKGTTCGNCQKNTSKAICQTDMQFHSDDDNFKEHEAIQTSLMPPSISNEKPFNLNDNMNIDLTICPLCGISGNSISVEDYHEHVLNHFLKDGSIKDFELVD